MVEYALLVALISIVSIAGVAQFGEAVRCSFFRSAAVVSGQATFLVTMGTSLGTPHMCDFDSDGDVDLTDFVGLRQGMIPCCIYS